MVEFGNKDFARDIGIIGYIQKSNFVLLIKFASINYSYSQTHSYEKAVKGIQSKESLLLLIYAK